ncbi:MAG: 6,7-dimethyl-8-ribityllumazine synthase [Nitrososphaerales archaeon]
MTKKARLGIVVSEFNQDITSRMLDRATKRADSLDASVKYVCYVPGTFDIALMVENLLRKRDVDAVVTLGAVIKGETKHDEVIANNASRLIADLSLKYGKPVTLGISGPSMSEQQARDRVNAVSTRAVTAAVNMVDRIKKLEVARSNSTKVIR